MYIFSCSKTSALGSIQLTVFDMSRVAACCKCRHTCIFHVEDMVVSKARFTLWQTLTCLIICFLFVWMSNSALIVFALWRVSFGTPRGSIFVQLMKSIYKTPPFLILRLMHMTVWGTWCIYPRTLLPLCIQYAYWCTGQQPDTVNQHHPLFFSLTDQEY